MPCPVVPDLVAPPLTKGKPNLSSYDSGQECSITHWLEVCKLVEIAEYDSRELNGYVFEDSLLVHQ
jgi:hypothetical protein